VANVDLLQASSVGAVETLLIAIKTIKRLIGRLSTSPVARPTKSLITQNLVGI